MASKFVINPLMQKVDELAKLRAKLTAMREKEQELSSYLKAKLDSRKEGAVIHGYLSDVMLSSYSMKTLSPTKLEKFLTPEQIAKCYKSTKVEKLVFTTR